MTLRRAIIAVVAVILPSTVPAWADADPTALEQGVARFAAHDFAGAIGSLARAHAEAPTDAEVALLLGIAEYRVGHPAIAEPLLALAATSPDPETVASARIFLGLIADARGESARARTYYALVASSPTTLGAAGGRLLERGGDTWSLAIVSRPGYDSNVALQPATATARGSGGDADLTTVGVATVRPSSELDLVLDESALYRRHVRMTDYDLLSNTVGAAATFGGSTDHVMLAYHFEASLLGGSRYDLGHAGDVAYLHSFGDGLGAAVRYSLDARDYAPPAYAGYTGLSHTGIAELAWGTPSTAKQLSIGYVLERDNTADRMLTATGNGGRLTVRGRAASGVELRGSALASYRSYDAASLGRRDLYVTADAGLYVELTRVFGVVLGGTLVRNASNAAATDYLKWTVYAGVSATTGS
jgi:hypothetical protein